MSETGIDRSAAARLRAALSGADGAVRAGMGEDGTGEARAAEPPLAAALAAWSREPALAGVMAAADGAYLVLDGGRVAHASAGAAALADRQAVSDQIRSQVLRPGTVGTTPRLVRLRLDPRRLAAPALCLIARGPPGEAEALTLVALAGPLPAPRPRAARAEASVPNAAPEAAPEAAAAQEPPRPPAGDAPPPAPPAAGERFVWRSDAAGRLTEVSGEGLAALAGRTWADLVATGALAEGAVLREALAARDTFRAVAATLALTGARVAVEMSGAPRGRGEAFAGFGGFGVVRAVTPVEAPRPPSPPPAATAAADAPAGALSVSEHAAFREIARALGARYAGDGAADGMAAEPRRPEGVVMAFPSPVPGGLEAAFLDGVPEALLIHRGDAVLAANRLALDLTGYADLAALAAAGMAALFRGLLPEADEVPVALARADGQARPVELRRGRLTWAGAPATCLVLRERPADDPAARLAAERVARGFGDRHAALARAALDALDEGVVSLDGDGRVLALNRAAARLLDCDPREVVGGAFADLFDPGAAVRAALDGAAADVVVPLRGDGAACLRLVPAGEGRVALLRAPPGPAAAADPSPTGLAAAGPAAETAPTAPAVAVPALLVGLAREIRAPVRAIRAAATGMLGAAQPRSEQDRASLEEVRGAADDVRRAVRDVSDIALAAAGGLRLAPRDLSLNDLVAACVEGMRGRAARSRIVLRTSFAPDLQAVEADERSLRRAVLKLLGAAIRMAGAGGQVIVSTASAGADVTLRVRDTGAGLDAEAIAAALQPFAASGPKCGETRRGAAGTLDFALARALAEANGGRLRITSRREEGTLAEILLPARPVAAP